jgi:hypothetical protein
VPVENLPRKSSRLDRRGRPISSSGLLVSAAADAAEVFFALGLGLEVLML